MIQVFAKKVNPSVLNPSKHDGNKLGDFGMRF